MLWNSILNWLADSLGRAKVPVAGPVAPPVATALVHETQSLPETLARIAESQVGVREDPRKNNTGVQVQAYQSATWLAGTAWPWCAAFVCWCVWQTLQQLGLKPADWVRPRTTGAWDLENWGRGVSPHKRNGAWQVFRSTPQTPPRRGDIITFTWSHCGIVTGYDPKTKCIYTVEGNASAKEQPDAPTGDGVCAKKQHVTKCRMLIRYNPPA